MDDLTLDPMPDLTPGQNPLREPDDLVLGDVAPTEEDFVVDGELWDLTGLGDERIDDWLLVDDGLPKDELSEGEPSGSSDSEMGVDFGTTLGPRGR